jgi:UPF0755 protein
MPKAKRKLPMQLLTIVSIVIVLIFGSLGYAAVRYRNNNLKPVSSNQTTVTLTIPKGSSLADVTTLLKKNGLIRNEWVFKQYVRSQGLQDQILAGTYALKPSQSVSEIVAILTEGRVENKLITIKPGQRLDQIKQTFINSGFSVKDTEAAFNPAQYEGHPALVDKPRGANLEGYLYPESFQKDGTTKPSQIITSSLDEMQKRLTPELRAQFAKKGLSVYQGITLASIIEQEVSNLDDKPLVAQVFYKRLGMDMGLESDPTAFYGAIIAGQEPSLRYDSPYNTYLVKGLPPGPISNVTQESLRAAANPANTDWLFFVAGDDGKTYYSKTLAEHEANIDRYCKKLCN